MAAVIVLFTFGLFWLSATHRQLDNIQQITVEEQRYLRVYNQAESSLNWGMHQIWDLPSPLRADSTWHCITHQKYGLKACIKQSSLRGFFILRGDSASPEALISQRLYQRIKLEPIVGRMGNYQLVKASHGWLDFCPDKDEQFCIDQGSTD